MVTNKKRVEQVNERLNMIKSWPKRFKNIPKSDFCEKAKISRTGLWNILKGHTIPSLETIERLEICLKKYSK